MTVHQSPRRSGGRRARHALRAAPTTTPPVWPGMTGGTYCPLSENDVARIHGAALTALEEIGLADAPESGIALMTGAGATLGEDGRLRFPPRLVEHMLTIAARDITLHGRDARNDLALHGTRVHFGTAGAAVEIVDAVTHTYRKATLADLYKAARLTDALDNIHFCQRPIVARDIEDPFALDLNTIHACVNATTKHIGTSFTEASSVARALEMLHIVAGGEAAWRARPFMSNSNCFVVPPMKFATESCLVLEEAVRGGMPVLLLSAGQAGATAPASLSGALVQAVAECLAGLIYVNALSPGHPAIMGTWPFVSDLRTGAMSGGSGEQGLLTAASAQMHRFYGLPGGAAAGMTDAKLPDMQAGWEQAMSNVTAGLSGLNMVYEAAGMHASLLGFCFESLILGDDLIGQALRMVRGLEVDEGDLGLDAMRSVCLGGPGHYLGHDDTLGRMEKDYFYPRLGNRLSPTAWAEAGAPEIIVRARDRVEEIMAIPSPAALPDALNRQIEDRFGVQPIGETTALSLQEKTS